ncbi:hypothetical protein SXCC_00076 [Gluconacetobacter sp. SXCC-1]|nr:hypothetical protein SXCC_00076 [Gluconacetobacter sp. SXCC-1]
MYRLRGYFLNNLVLEYPSQLDPFADRLRGWLGSVDKRW